MSDLQANIYATVSIDRVKVTLDKLHKFYYVLEYKDQKFNSSENPVKTQEIQWTDLRFTFKLDENEAKTDSFKFQLWGPATKLKRSDFIIAEANVSFKDFLAKHAPNFEPVEREPQYNFESVFVRKGKEHGSLLFSSEVTGWKIIDDMLKSEDEHTRERAFQNLKLLSTTKNPKLNQYIRAETFQTINEAIRRSIKSAKKVKSPRKDTEKLIEDEKPSNTKDEKTNDARKAYLELWEMLCKIDVNMRTKLISLGALPAIKKFIKCSDLEVQLHFLEMLKQFFTLAAHQKEIIKEDLLKKLISLVTAGELRIQMKAFEILLYFDEVHQPEMIRLGLVGKLISLLKHTNPSVQAKALEIIQYFDAKHQDLLISTGALKELTDLIQLDPKDAFTHGLILKTLSVISHFDVPHQREILEQQMHIPLLELLKLDSEKIKLKTLSVIEGFDPSYGQKFLDAGLLQYINILLDDERITIKNKAFETVTKLKHHTTEIIQVGILDRLLNLLNDSNAVLQMNAFEFIQKFPATQQQLIHAGVLKNVNAVLKTPLTTATTTPNIVTVALEFLITFEAAHYKQIIDAGLIESVLGIMAQKLHWTMVPYNKILNLCFNVIQLYKVDYEDEIVGKKAQVFLDMLRPGTQRLDENSVFELITSFKKWRQHLKPVLQGFMYLLIDAREKVRKGVMGVLDKYPSEEHCDLMQAGLLDVLLNSFLVANQNAAVAQSFFNLMTSLKGYQEELYKTQARYEKLITIAKLNEIKRVQVLDLFSQLEESVKPKVLKYNLIGNLLEFAAVAPSTSKYSGAKLLDMITSFDGWKEALLELKALKNLTDFLNNPAKALQIKAMDLLEEFSTEKQVAMMQDGLVQALLQTVVVNEDEGVQSRALDYLSNISHNPTFMEILCTSKDGSIVDGFTVRMDKSTAHPSIVIEDGSKLMVDATKQTYANWCTCYGVEAMTKGVRCWEMVIESPNMNNFMVGVCNKNQRNTEYLGQNVNGWSLYYSSGTVYFYHGGNSQVHKTQRLAKGDTIGLIYDAENGQLEMYVKDEYAGIVHGGISGDIYPAVSLYNNTDVVTFRSAPQLAVKRETVIKEEQVPMNPIEAEVINQWIGTTNAQTQWFLAYKASVHGWNTRNFHTRCDFKGPTVTIVRTPDAVFGGYSALPWAPNGGYKRDNDAFLFSLRNPHNTPPSKHPLYRNQQNSVYHDTASGPTFGGGFDLYVNLSSKETSYSNLGFSYQGANPVPPGVNAAYYFTGRNSQWQIADVEVYLQQKPKRVQRKLLLYQFVRTIEIAKPHIAKKFKEILFSIAGKKSVYKAYLLAVVQKILTEPGLLKPMQTTLEELKAGFGASGIELLPYRVVSVNGKKEVPAKDLSKQDGKYLESDAEDLEIVLEVLPRKIAKADDSNDNTDSNTNNNNNNNNTNTNVVSNDEEELPYITHFVVSAPIKQLSDKYSSAKDIMCFLSSDEPDTTQLAKYNAVKFDDPSFEFKELLDLQAEKASDAALSNNSLLDFNDNQEEAAGVNNNNVVDDKNDEELKALKKFLLKVKLGVHKPPPPPPEVQTNQYGYVFVNEANERVRHKDEAMVDLSQFANGVITYRVEYLATGNFEWLPDSTAVEDVIEVPPRPKVEVKDEAKEREEKERIEKLERELEEKEREEKERKERELKEKGEQINRTPAEREKDRVAAILAELRRDDSEHVESQALLQIAEPYKPVAVIELDSLGEKPLKQATLARYVTIKVLRSAKVNTLTTLSHVALVGFFKSANKQPLPPPTTMVDISRRFGFVKEGIKMFNYVSDGDTNGVLYWIGTQDGKSSVWSNPAESKRVTVTTSHPMFNTWMKPELILDRGSIINYWGSDLPIYFTLDMQNYEVYITHFTIRHAHNQAYGYIQNFSLSGSKDGTTWVQLFNQVNCPFTKPHDAATLTVPEGQDFYRYFRLTQSTSYKDSPNFTGGPFMFISGFEVYGTMRYFN